MTRRTTLTLLAATMLFAATGCAVVRWTTTIERDYNYIGGVELGAARHENGTTTIPLEIDTMAGDLWMDSGHTLYDAPTDVEGDTIYFQVRTCLASAHSSPQQLTIQLQDLEPGTYKVVYRSSESVEHDIGEITVPANAAPQSSSSAQ